MFKKKRVPFLGFLLFLTFPTIVFAGKNNKNLAVSLIPDSLRINAHAVVRYDSTKVEVINLKKVKYKRIYAITILDEAGKDYGDFFKNYSLLIQIDHIDGTFYDANGNESGHLKKKEIFDRSMSGTGYFFNVDSRLKSYHYSNSNFPYTVVYEIEETIKTTYFIPKWKPQQNSDCAVEKSNYSLSFPKEFSIRHKAYLMPLSLKHSKVEKEGIVFENWSVRGIPAFLVQPYSIVANFNKPTLLIAPSNFNFMGYEGKMDSWHNYGLFIYELNKGRDSLPENIRKKVHELISKDTSTFQKIQTLYRYMQKNTHYVADEYGISGLQTFSATNVCTNGYGDCKGLTNYLKALLKEAGIKAYATLASAGADDFYKVDVSFPSDNFDHVILCIPEKKDTFWVECTSPLLPAGYLGDFAANRLVLVCTKNGGYLARTPNYGKDKTFIIRKAKFVYNDSTEKQQVKLNNYYSGFSQDNLLMSLKMLPEDKIQQMVNSEFSFPSYHVNHFKYRFVGTPLLPAIVEDVEASVYGLISKTDKRIFINLGWMDNPMNKIVQINPRTKPLVLNKSFCVTDTVTFTFPKGMKMESIPSEKHFQFPFASFDCTIYKEDNLILLVRKYVQNTGVFDSASFADYQKLYHIINSENTDFKVVLFTKNPAQ